MAYRISRTALVLVWIVTILLAFIFLNAGRGKFADGFWTLLFQRWGLPHWFQLTIGVEEVIAAALLVWPKTARLGAVLVAATMVGAMILGIVHGEFRNIPAEVVSLTFATIIFAARQRMANGSKSSGELASQTT